MPGRHANLVEEQLGSVCFGLTDLVEFAGEVESLHASLEGE